MIIGSKLEKIGAILASWLVGYSAADVKLLASGENPVEFTDQH